MLGAGGPIWTTWNPNLSPIVRPRPHEEANAAALAEGGEPATAQTVLLGLIKAALNTTSWLSAASFQETTRVSV